jgi:hypothetical protein
VNTLDGFLKLAFHHYKTLDQPHQVADLKVINTTTVDRAGATIVASTETNNLKIAMLLFQTTWLFLHGGGDDEDDV